MSSPFAAFACAAEEAAESPFAAYADVAEEAAAELGRGGNEPSQEQTMPGTTTKNMIGSSNAGDAHPPPGVFDASPSLSGEWGEEDEKEFERHQQQW